MARIKIDLDRKIGSVDRRVFGGFVEHLGRCIYGGIYDEGSPLSDDQGYRRDVMEAIRALRVPVLRWPGGNFVSGYHWLDGVGPKDRRPRRMELAWHSEEPNRFGTDEFMEYCRRLGAEPYICINMGTGTLDEAQGWVEYCNGTGNTYWANLRRQNGHPEPYGVKYWGLGNEVYGHWQIGALGADDYVKKAVEFAKVMKWTDPSIQLVGCGDLGWTDWDRVVLEGLAPYVDYHSVHIYTGSDDYYSNVLAPHQAERALRIVQALIDRVRYEQRIAHPIYVAYDEWNVWYRARGAETRLEERYTLADALAVATYLNVFIRHCRTVRIANLAQLVNVIAPIFTSPDGLFLQTIYHPFRLYSEHTLEYALDPYVECETYDLDPTTETSPRPHRVADLGPFPLLDVVATCDSDDREVVLGVVNRDRERAIETAIQLADGLAVKAVVAYEVTGAEPGVTNSFEQPDAVTVQEHLPVLQGTSLTYTFPAHSLTLLRLQVGRE
ncbi:MAG: alpha-N-arabinofuranosidase [Chloroflexota bacterium]